MKKFALISLFALILFACGQQPKSQEKAAEAAAVLSVDELLEKAPELANKEVTVKGTVFHVCQQGGERCFLMGSTEDFSIRIEAGEKIGAFTQEQMGSDLEIVGILKEVLTEADAHNPGKEHGEEGEEHVEDAETEAAHQVLAENQEAAERIFFIEGLSVKEMTE
ncbi:hypothetical protein SLH46_10070 [Draconibacterium sp. IB214405]|uniref:hypothetical protein n=1 Tax=Draconibacterium sp. IB214405 TaxID=3097352 RepID=UPI002A100302|nr:hypothetical protein [Draconibacterium sp. IB214405]MDX8339529.1 hypothetical protein [Draconibacterium sp. IB214405]